MCTNPPSKPQSSILPAGTSFGADVFFRSEVTVYEHPLLKFDSTGFLLQMAFKDGIFPDFDIPAQLWEQRVPEDDPLLKLRKHPSKLNLPVLKTVTRHGSFSDKMLNESTFKYYFQQIVRNAGYYGVLTIRALRRSRERS